MAPILPLFFRLFFLAYVLTLSPPSDSRALLSERLEQASFQETPVVNGTRLFKSSLLSRRCRSRLGKGQRRAAHSVIFFQPIKPNRTIRFLGAKKFVKVSAKANTNKHPFLVRDRLEFVT